MARSFEAVKVTDKVYWVGAIDWGLRDFHGYSTERGTTYNAYLIMADKITLIDAVKKPFYGELMARISSVIDPTRIDYIISNHAEPDHSGCLAQVADVTRAEKILASPRGVTNLKDHFVFDDRLQEVKDGSSLSLGNMTLNFLETPMLHWPDSMFSYLVEEALLFSNDAFGMHYATAERFMDEVPNREWEYQAAKYYANILMPYSGNVTRLVQRVKSLNLKLSIIAPDHGPIWRQDPAQIVNTYENWALQKPTRKAVVIYDTMWDSTDVMARRIAEGLMAGGASVKVMPLKGCHRSDVVTEVLTAGAVIVGSPTMNNNIFPTVADILTYLKGLKPKNKIGAAFGSYGWSGEAPAQVREYLQAMKMEIVGDEVRAKFVPTDDVLAECYDLGKQIAARLAGI